MKVAVLANAFAALPTFIWTYLFLTMANHYAPLPAYGYSGAWDFWVYFPMAMALALLIAIVVLNRCVRKPGILVLIAGVGLLPILPYGMMISGGV